MSKEIIKENTIEGYKITKQELVSMDSKPYSLYEVENSKGKVIFGQKLFSYDKNEEERILKHLEELGIKYNEN